MKFEGSSSPWDPSTQPLVSANYNTIGNITSRSDVNAGSTWAYDANRPHAVTTAGSNSYSYDANGRMSTRNGSSVWWLPFNKPRAIFSASNSYTFYYDNNRNRVLETVIQNGTQRSIVKYGSLYEEVADNGVDTYRLFIPTPMGVIGVWNRGDLGDQKRYHHKDLLGSVGLETNESGTVQNQYAYDPWGAPRVPSTWASLSTWPNYGSDRGYTSHEMLEGLDLVHMNGRIYDPAIGRFLTADPIVQFTGDSQSYNRYSYVLNNPLRYTDPSGHELVTILTAIYWASQGTAAITASMELFVVSMFFAGAADAMIAGADLEGAIKAGAFTAAAAWVTHGIGSYFENNAATQALMKESKPFFWAARATAHGVTSGAFSEIAGGEFGSGFAAGFAGSFGGSVGQKVGNAPGFVIAIAAAGTAAELGGGKFANGAATAAFIYLVTPIIQNPKNSNELANPLRMISPLAKWLWNDLSTGFKGILWDKPLSVLRGVNSIWNGPGGAISKIVKTPLKILQNTLIPTQGKWLGSDVGFNTLTIEEQLTSSAKDFISPGLSKTQNASIEHDFAGAQSPRDPMRHVKWVQDVWIGTGFEPGPFGQLYRLMGTFAFPVFSGLESLASPKI